MIANQTNPGITNGGVGEFELTDPVVALQGSGTADAPYLLLTLDTTGKSNVTVAYSLRDIDATADNSVQPVALQFRVGTSGSFTNVPAGFVADATTGPSLATLVTAVSAVLPAAAGNQPLVQVRVITTNAVGSDEWVGVDDISVTAPVADQAPSVLSTTPVNGDTGVPVDSNISITFSEPVNVSPSSFAISCPSGTHTATVGGGPTTFSLDPEVNFAASENCTVNVVGANVFDQDGNDPPDTMAADYPFSFTTAAAPPQAGDVVVSEVYGGGGNLNAVYTNDYIELYNRTGSAINLAGWSVQYASSAGTTWAATPLSGTIPAGRNYLVQEAAGGTPVQPLPSPDATGTILMSATSGKVALVSTTTSLSGACPTGGSIMDFVGYGAANCFEGTGPTRGADQLDLGEAERRRRDGHERQRGGLHRRNARPPSERRPGPERRGDDSGSRRQRRRARGEHLDHVQRAGRRRRELVHDLVRNERRPRRELFGRADDVHARSVDQLRAERVVHRHRPRSERDGSGHGGPAEQHGGELRLHLPDRRRRRLRRPGYADPRRAGIRPVEPDHGVERDDRRRRRGRL